MFEIGPGIAGALSMIYALQSIGTLVVADVDGDMKPDEALGASLYAMPGYVNGTRPPSEGFGLGVTLNDGFMQENLASGRIILEEIKF